jgi:anti-anti-sigma regulatory factor
MHSNTKSGSDTEIVFIRIGRHFDFRLRDQFLRACRTAQLARARKIVIDLAQTRRLHESGLALLMMLHDRAWCLRDGIELVNCSAPLLARFKREVYPGIFSIPMADC